MVYRSAHALASDYLSSNFEKRETAYNLRDSENKRNVPLPRTNYHKNSFSHSDAILRNGLPCDLREAESLGQFKRPLNEVQQDTAFVNSSFLFQHFSLYELLGIFKADDFLPWINKDHLSI